MKTTTITLLLVLTSLFSFSQKHFPIGIYAEGGYFFPKGHPGTDVDNNFAAGGGGFIDSNITPKLTVSLKAGYRYKSNKAASLVMPDDGYGGYGDGYETIDLDYQQHYFILPFKVSYLVSLHFFVETGIETTWLLNYDRVRKKPEFNWLFGVGYQMGRFKTSLNYVHGIKEQGMGPVMHDGVGYGQVYKNRMFMFSLSYSIFEWKK